MNLSAYILKIFGWRLHITVPDVPKSIICVAPHTSNWDFVIGKLSYMALGRKAGFLMKSSWFFFPLGYFFRAIGGVPVYRNEKRNSLVEQLVKKFETSEKLNLAITPEGTRKRNPRWHTGFLRIAYETDVPIFLGVLDFEHKLVIIDEIFQPSGNIEEDLKAVKKYYRPFKGKYPDKFSADDE